MTNSPSNSVSKVPEPTSWHGDAGWLIAEATAATEETNRALLLYEAAHVEERAGNATEAARLFLQAVNTDPRFSEPVERLLSLFQQRQSSKNIGRVLERLALLATTADERERAALQRAAFAFIEQSDAESAKQILTELNQTVQPSNTIWMLLQHVAEKSGDTLLFQRALTARANLSLSKEWSGLLWLELAESQAGAGDFEGATQSIDRVIDDQGPCTFAAYELLANLSASNKQQEMLATAQVGLAALIEKALRDSLLGDSVGVPRWRRQQVYVAEALLQAAIARHAAGNTSEAATLLEKARSLQPADPVLQRLSLLCARHLGDLELAASQALSIAENAKGPLLASAWLRVALIESDRERVSEALAAIGKGLAEAPNSVALRALQLYLLASDDNPTKYAAALESSADLVSAEAAKAHCFLAAAYSWARRNRDPGCAKAALIQAGLLGTAPNIINRFARLLATELPDSAWYEEATRRLASSAATTEEQAELWLDLLRIRTHQRKTSRVTQALAGLKATEPGRWLASMFDAWAPGESEAGNPSMAPSQQPPSNDERALVTCAKLCENEPFRQAYELVDTVQELRRGHHESALEVLRGLHQRAPANVVAALALSELQFKANAAGGIETLCVAAASVADDTLGAMMATKAAIIAARLNSTAQYLTALDTGRSRAAESTAIIEQWLGRCLGLDTAASPVDNSPNTEARHGLDQFAKHIRERNLDQALAALDRPSSDIPSLDLAILIARLIAEGCNVSGTLTRLAELVPSLGPVCTALGVRIAVQDAGLGSPDHLRAARKWVELEPSSTSALELLVTARVQGKTDDEQSAWELLADNGTPRIKSQALLARARLTLLTNTEPPPIIATDSREGAWFNLESSRPGCDPRRRLQALAGMQDLHMGADQRLSAILIAFNSLASGLTDQAQSQFKAISQLDPQSISALEGLCLAAELNNDWVAVADATEALGQCMGEAKLAAEYYERASSICLERLHDDERGEALLALAVSNDITRSAAFDKLFRRVRSRNDSPKLLELIDLRLNVSEDVDELVMLHWERARVLRALGKRDEALQALESVTLLEPEHVGALALAAEIAISTQQLAEAARYLDQLARLSAAPLKQRLMSAAAAADLYGSKLSQPQTAVALLQDLAREDLLSLELRERLVRYAVQVENWSLAYNESLNLARLRETSASRVAAARLALGICREQLHDPEAALPAVRLILAELPTDLEAIDFVLERPFSDTQNDKLCAQAIEDLRLHLEEDPVDAEATDRLAQLAASLGKADLRQVALGCLATLGTGTAEIYEELTLLDTRVARVPSIALDEESFSELAAPDDTGAVPEAFAQLAPHFNEALGPHLSVLGVTKKQRVEPRAGHPLRNEVAAWAGALGVGDFELYLGGISPNDIIGLPTEIPVLVIGNAVTAPLTPHHRQQVAAELYAIRRGTSILRHRSPVEVAAALVAVCRIAGVNVSSPAYAMLDEFTRLLSATLPRKVRKNLPSICAPFADRDLGAEQWSAAAMASRDRLAVLAAGDVSQVLGRNGELPASVAGLAPDERRRRLLSFVYSPQYLSLRDRLGLGVK